MSRVAWFVGFNGKVESFKMAKLRAKASAEILHELALTHDKVAFLGHGMLNKYIYPLPIKLLYSVVISDAKARRSMMTSQTLTALIFCR